MAEKIPSRTSGSAGGSAASSKPATPPSAFSLSRFILIFLAILALFIMIDPTMRQGFSEAVGLLLYPVVGFGGAFPIWTLFFAGILMTAFSTCVRHYFTNWVEQARIQKIQAAFNKENMDALRKGNVQKKKRLDEKKLQIMQMNTKNMKSSLKVMAVTFFLIISVFSWLWLFLGQIPDQSFSVPWALDITFTSNPVLLPNWILLYSLVSLPVGMMIGRVLKHYSFSKRLAALEGEKRSKRRENNSDVAGLQKELDGSGQ